MNAADIKQALAGSGDKSEALVSINGVTSTAVSVSFDPKSGMIKIIGKPISYGCPA